MGTTKITKKTAADYIIRRFNLEASEDATMVQDDTNFHFFIPVAEYDRNEVVSALTEWLNGKVIIGGRCRIEQVVKKYVIVHIEDVPPTNPAQK